MDQKAIQPYYKSLESIYAPQRQLLQQQMKSLPQQYAMERSGLEQAKLNAFRDISSKARGMGVAFGGYSPSEQARYTGATYLPALGKIQQAQTEGLTSLQSALNQLYGTQQKEAMGLYQTAQQQAEARRQWEAEMAEQRRQANMRASSGGGGESRPTLQQSILGLGTIAKTGSNYARFINDPQLYAESGGKAGYFTREQAARQVALDTGVSYEDALKAIYNEWKTGDEMKGGTLLAGNRGW